MIKVRKPRQPESRTRRLQDKELDTLLSVNQKCKDDWLTKCILLAIETGMRRGELLNVRKCDLDFKSRVLTIPHTKNGYTRIIPLSSKSISIFRDRLWHRITEASLLIMAEVTFQNLCQTFRCMQSLGANIPVYLKLIFLPCLQPL